MGGADKGWVPWQGRPLVELVHARLQDQVGEVIISANRNQARYRALGCPVVEDDVAAYGAFPGPLAGMLAGLRAAQRAWVAFVPCDAPLLPVDLVARLALAGGGRQAAFASCAGRHYPVFCLVPARAGAEAAALLARGERRPARFLEHIGALALPFEDGAAFANINETPGTDGHDGA